MNETRGSSQGLALDQLSVDQLVVLMCGEVQRVPDALSGAAPAIAEVVRAAVERLGRGGRLIYVGAGSAGRIGVLDAAEIGPTFGAPEGQVVGILAGGAKTFLTPDESAEDDPAAGAAELAALELTRDDVVVGISASGRTPFVLGAVTAANSAGALSVALSSTASGPLSSLAGLAIEVPVGTELLSGSTRLNAGTAQKAVLNIISTAVMIQLGRTYGNLMVDVRPTNAKLRQRAVQMVGDITSKSDADVVEALEAAAWNPKVAAAMISLGASSARAVELLVEAGGRLRTVLERPAGTSADISGAAGDPAQGRSSGAGSAAGHRWTRLGVAGAVVDGVLLRGDVAVAGGEVMAVGLAGPGRGIAIPGLVDLQVNGYAGVDLLNAELEEIVSMGAALLRDGVMAYQPTLITSDPSDTLKAISRLNDLATRRLPGARILGIHLEGPFLSPMQPGTHPKQHLRLPDIGLLCQLLDAGGVRTITLAPELPGASGLIEKCVERAVAVWVGHSAATAEESDRAFALGASAVTHIFNAMDPMRARAPGVAGSALTTPGVAIQVICDGRHVSDQMLRLILAAAGERASVVTDAIAAAGLGEGPFRLGDVAGEVRHGVALRQDGTMMGGTAPLHESVARLVGLGVPLGVASEMVSRRPARLLGDQGLGTIGPNRPADLVVLDEESLSLERVVVQGLELERS